jgi:hypothetical protein
VIGIGVDVGGTFTDLVLEQTFPGGGQKISVHKVASTPEDQSIGVVRGIVEVCRIASVGPHHRRPRYVCRRHVVQRAKLYGGKAGAVGKYKIYNTARPDEIKQYPAKFSGLRVEEGDVACCFSPSGGGYGDPLERPAEQVLEDVLDDFITPEHAREAYAVVLRPADNGYPWALDEGAADKLRAAMRA